MRNQSEPKPSILNTPTHTLASPVVRNPSPSAPRDSEPLPALPAVRNSKFPLRFGSPATKLKICCLNKGFRTVVMKMKGSEPRCTYTFNMKPKHVRAHWKLNTVDNLIFVLN